MLHKDERKIKDEDDAWCEEEWEKEKEEEKEEWIAHISDIRGWKKHTIIDLRKQKDQIASEKKRLDKEKQRLEWEEEALEKLLDLKEEEEAAWNEEAADLEKRVRLVKPKHLRT